MNAIVIAPGESLTQEQCDATRGYGLTIAVSDAYKLAPWCDAICATDYAWWRARPETMAMPCRRFSVHKIEGVERVEPNSHLASDSSSGVLGLEVARMLGAKRILMLGFDNKGTHFFGEHKLPLKNTPEHRFKVFANQFFHLRGRLKLDGIDVFNCTPGTALDIFPKATLAEGLQWLTLSRSAA